MVHFILGTRAQLIKTAPVMREFEKAGAPYNFVFIAQHKETIAEMVKAFRVRDPDFTVGNIDSDISHPGLMAKWLAVVMGQLLTKGGTAFKGDGKGIAVVHGDALPALLGAAWAKLNGLKVAHLEAGLRSFNYLNPFPEELIRVALWRFHLADLCFCPNEWAVHNLAPFSMRTINTHHNTLLDSLRIAAVAPVPSTSVCSAAIPPHYGIVSLHRAETLMSKSGLATAMSAIAYVSETIPLVFVLHPSTRKTLESRGLLEQLRANPNLVISPRLDYFTFIRLLKNSEFLITDGGSNQEECYYLGHPCLLLRATTERVEGMGKNVLISNFKKECLRSFVDGYRDYRMPPIDPPVSPSEIVFRHLEEFIP